MDTGDGEIKKKVGEEDHKWLKKGALLRGFFAKGMIGATKQRGQARLVTFFADQCSRS